MLIEIKKKRIEEYWRTPCCKTAVLVQHPEGTADLIVYDNGTKVFEGRYKTRKGAVVSMGKRYGHCKFHHMIDVLETRRL